jgi:lipoprotein-releasing system permease protein
VSPYEVAVGLRYTRARKGSGRNTFISFIALISMAGIALGVAALIVVLSVMNGFQLELRNRILSVASHIEIRGFPSLRDPVAVADAAKKNPRVVATAPYVSGQAMLASGDVNRGALLRGVDPAQEDKVADIGRHMRVGTLDSLTPGSFNIVLGAELARALGARVGDTVVAITPQGNITPAGALPRIKTFHVSGIFEVGMFEFDSGLALVNLDDAEKLYRLDGVTGVRLKLDDMFAAPRVASELIDTMPADTDVRDWTRSHANFFRAVAIEKRVMFIILTLIVAVAAFNIVSAQVMELIDESERPVAHGTARSFRELGERRAFDAHFTAGRQVEPAEQVQQRALARPRRADDRDALADRDVEIDAEQHRHVERPIAIRLAQVAARDHRHGGAGGDRRVTHTAARRRDSRARP